MNRPLAKRNGNTQITDNDVLYFIAGAGLLFVGAGLLLSSGIVRRSLGEVDFGRILEDLVPNVDRYLRAP